MPEPSFVGSVNNKDVSLGAKEDEEGIILGDLSFDLENPQVDFFDRFGAVTGYATNHQAALNYSVSGVVSDKDAGLNVATFTAAVTLANDDFFSVEQDNGNTDETYHGIKFKDDSPAVTSAIRLVGVSGTQPQGGARTIDLSLNRPLGLVIS